MEGDDDFGVPAGWYPDPLGLPQLRWWDGQAWTEFTSEAQAPVMMQASPVLPEPAFIAAATAAAGTSDAGVAAAAAAIIEATSVAEPVIRIAEPVAQATPAVPIAESVPTSTTAWAEPLEPVTSEPAVNVHNLGEQMQFLTRRERREYERRLDAEAALFPHTVDASASPAAYIQEPVVPEVARPAAAQIIVEPAAAAAFAPGPSAAVPLPTTAFAGGTTQSQPLQPEPLFSPPLVAESTVPPVSFADLLRPPGGDDGETALEQSGALLVPVEPPPFVASGLRELEPALADILAEAALAPRAGAAPATSAPSGFDIDEIVVEEEPAPDRTTTAKRTYTPAAWIIAASPVIQVALAYLVVFVLGQSSNRPVIAVIWFGGLVVAAGIAGYDRLLLKASGHERPAAGWWALLTPARVPHRALESDEGGDRQGVGPRARVDSRGPPSPAA